MLGGTFDRLHAGHRALLAAAFRAGRTVGIGLTTDAYLRRHTKPLSRRIAPFAARERRLVGYLRRRWPRRRWWIRPLEDRFGGSVAPGVGVLVASEESRAGARAVNRERRRRGIPPVRLALVPLVRGEDRLPISSRRIRAGLIDSGGRRRRPLDIRIVAPAEWNATIRSGLRRLWPGVPIRIRSSPPPRGRRAPREGPYLARRLRAARGEGEVGLLLWPEASRREGGPWGFGVVVGAGAGEIVRSARRISVRDVDGRVESVLRQALESVR